MSGLPRVWVRYSTYGLTMVGMTFCQHFDKRLEPPVVTQRGASGGWEGALWMSLSISLVNSEENMMSGSLCPSASGTDEVGMDSSHGMVVWDGSSSSAVSSERSCAHLALWPGIWATVWVFLLSCFLRGVEKCCPTPVDKLRREPWLVEDMKEGRKAYSKKSKNGSSKKSSERLIVNRTPGDKCQGAREAWPYTEALGRHAERVMGTKKEYGRLCHMQRGIREVRWRGESNRRLPSIYFRNIRKYLWTSVGL